MAPFVTLMVTAALECSQVSCCYCLGGPGSFSHERLNAESSWEKTQPWLPCLGCCAEWSVIYFQACLWLRLAFLSKWPLMGLEIMKDVSHGCEAAVAK